MPRSDPKILSILYHRISRFCPCTDKYASGFSVAPRLYTSELHTQEYRYGTQMQYPFRQDLEASTTVSPVPLKWCLFLSLNRRDHINLASSSLGELDVTQTPFVTQTNITNSTAGDLSKGYQFFSFLAHVKKRKLSHRKVSKSLLNKKTRSVFSQNKTSTKNHMMCCVIMPNLSGTNQCQKQLSFVKILKCEGT